LYALPIFAAMRSQIYNSRYFIVIGILIFLCFTGIWVFISGKLTHRTQQIGAELATKNYELKSTVIRSEFNNLIKGIDNLEAILPQIHNGEDFLKQQHIAEALLLNHPKIDKGWYAIASKQDTIYKAIRKEGNNYLHSTILKYQKDWIRHELTEQDTIAKSGTVIMAADTLHWLLSSKYKLSKSETLIFGLDINLRELQQYLWQVDERGRASAFLIDENGHYITNPLDSLIGVKMEVPADQQSERTYLSDSISFYQIVTSSYLQLPVFRYYTPLKIADMKWTMVIETPEFVASESAAGIKNYMTILFISAAFIILALIAWAQAKWQKEFMLRQHAEINKQELSIEKQALSLIAERQQKDNVLLQLNSLKQKVNPHFLFNSLSSLNALIEKSPELAKSFVVKLSRVYRYVLDSYPNGLATVNEELRFLNEYFFLLKIRFGDALEPLDINISPDHMEQRIPFMSLQTLIENAVKHNMLSKAKPLKIKIESIGDHIVITNNLQLRNDVRDSGKQGLSYLQSTYAYFGSDSFEYGEESNTYKVKLPLISTVD
jgi:two-component system LytT family sensor kinase